MAQHAPGVRRPFLRQFGEQAGQQIHERRRQVRALDAEQTKISRPVSAGRGRVQNTAEGVKVSAHVHCPASPFLRSGKGVGGQRPPRIGAARGNSRVEIAEVSDAALIKPHVVR